METTPKHIIVELPNNNYFDVTYYCSDKKLSRKEKINAMQLYIQLDDCVCIMKVDKSICERKHILESVVHNKVINTKGHLC
jgi:hypothetical protein